MFATITQLRKTVANFRKYFIVGIIDSLLFLCTERSEDFKLVLQLITKCYLRMLKSL